MDFADGALWRFSFCPRVTLAEPSSSSVEWDKLSASISTGIMEVK